MIEAALGLAALSGVGAALARPRLVVRPLMRRHPGVLFHLDPARRIVALAIDDGPDPEGTPALLAALRGAGVRATMFVLGENAEASPELMAELQAEGHEIAAHFWRDEITALRGAAAIEDSLDRTLDALARAGARPRFARPGFGVPSRAAARAAARRGLTLVAGDLPALDTLRLPDPLYRLYYRNVIQGGAILSFHDGRWRGARTARLVPALAHDLRRRGFRFVLLDGTDADRERGGEADDGRDRADQDAG